MATVAELVTNEIIQRLEAGTIPWFKPWQGGETVNYITGKPYQGINRLLLDGGEYATFKQITDRGGKVNKGAQGHIVVFYKPLTVVDEGEDEPKVIRMLRYYKVFNIADTNLQPKQDNSTEHTNYTIDNCQAVIDDYISREGIKLRNLKKSDRASYSPTTDIINLPLLSQFTDSKHYYATAYHEMAHSTGHKSRLDRLSKTAHFGNAEYSREELIAEITSAMLCNHTGIDTAEVIDNSAAYIGNWLQALKNDKNMILVASAKAEKAYNYILTGARA